MGSRSFPSELSNSGWSASRGSYSERIASKSPDGHYHPDESQPGVGAADAQISGVDNIDPRLLSNSPEPDYAAASPGVVQPQTATDWQPQVPFSPQPEMSATMAGHQPTPPAAGAVTAASPQHHHRLTSSPTGELFMTNRPFIAASGTRSLGNVGMPSPGYGQLHQMNYASQKTQMLFPMATGPYNYNIATATSQPAYPAMGRSNTSMRPSSGQEHHQAGPQELGAYTNSHNPVNNQPAGQPQALNPLQIPQAFSGTLGGTGFLGTETLEMYDPFAPAGPDIFPNQGVTMSYQPMNSQATHGSSYGGTLTNTSFGASLNSTTVSGSFGSPAAPQASVAMSSVNSTPSAASQSNSQAVSSQITLLYNDYEALLQAESQPQFQGNPNDPTIPRTLKEKQAVVKRFIAAMKDTRDIYEKQDSKTQKNRWSQGANYYPEAGFHAWAWRLLHGVLQFYSDGLPVHIHDREIIGQIRRTMADKFEERIKAIVELLTHSKATVMTLLRGEKLWQIITCPKQMNSSAKSNGKQNARKTVRIQEGKLARDLGFDFSQSDERTTDEGATHNTRGKKHSLVDDKRATGERTTYNTRGKKRSLAFDAVGSPVPNKKAAFTAPAAGVGTSMAVTESPATTATTRAPGTAATVNMNPAAAVILNPPADREQTAVEPPQTIDQYNASASRDQSIATASRAGAKMQQASAMKLTTKGRPAMKRKRGSDDDAEDDDDDDSYDSLYQAPIMGKAKPAPKPAATAERPAKRTRASNH